MKQFSYKYKIIIAVVLFVLLALGMFIYGYKILDQRNQVMSDAAMERESEYALLKTEQTSFEQGQKDLETLAKKEIPPDELFSKDTKVVKEIKALEDLAAANSVSFSLSISGTSKTAIKTVGSASDVYTVPYTATLRGSFDDVMRYMQKSEHLPFVTHTTSFNINSDEGGLVKAILNSVFFIKK